MNLPTPFRRDRRPLLAAVIGSLPTLLLAAEPEWPQWRGSDG